MKQMKKGDECFFYSSVSEKAIKGIMKIVKEYYPDHTDKKGIFGMVDVKYLKDINEVYLSDIKSDPFFNDFPLVRQPRLSVMPLSLKHWNRIIKISEKGS
jgi:predicted RNA-binding protein with PUA-like domain